MVIHIDRPVFAGILGGIGYHNNETQLWHYMSKEQREQVIAKIWQETEPGFSRCFAGFADWTKEAMDSFADCCLAMQKTTDTPIYMTPGRGKYHICDEDKKDYCERVADNLSYLIRDRGIDNVRYYCFSNEMGWSTGGALVKDLPTFKRYHELLYAALERRGLNVGLLATDASSFNNWNTLDWAIDNMEPITAAYCAHCYENTHKPDDKTFYAFFKDFLTPYVEKTLKREKHLILGEFGAGSSGCKKESDISIDVCRYFYPEKFGEKADSGAMLGILLTDGIFAAVNAGVYALALWSYSDYRDPGTYPANVAPFLGHGGDVRYNKWGLVHWESSGERPFTARPHYYALGLVTKFFKRNAYLTVNDCDDAELHILSTENADGSVSVGIVSRHDEPITVSVDVKTDKPLRIYSYNPACVQMNDFADLPDYTGFYENEITLLPNTLTILTSDYIEKAVTVAAEGLRIQNGELSWLPVSDRNHRYYRVFRDGIQIASTVGLSLSVTDSDITHYRVLSVDRSGNV